ncbi:hypothetical protein BRADI_1g33613v3 [Brachypodium distachyon]|uniref:Uncharacterized protein n=1 Tax=Brachypodium distachyon TaxID=15368 RepID=A0A0Q3H440_BRADI|nr:hypothetical protein BRADI_1g33613v3 [Brachypodium distachyon]
MTTAAASFLRTSRPRRFSRPGPPSHPDPIPSPGCPRGRLEAGFVGGASPDAPPLGSCGGLAPTSFAHRGAGVLLLRASRAEPPSA